MAATGEIIRATLSYTAPGSSVAQNVFYFQLGSSPSDDDLLDDVFEWCDDEWAEIWELFAPTVCSLADVKVDVVDTGGLVVRNIGTEVLDRAGNVVGGVGAAAVAATIFADTNRPKTRGRKFIPTIGEDLIGGGLFGTVAIGLLTTALEVYLASFTGTLGTVLVPGVISTVTAAFLPFTDSGGFDTIPDYQIRRRPDRGS